MATRTIYTCRLVEYIYYIHSFRVFEFVSIFFFTVPGYVCWNEAWRLCTDNYIKPIPRNPPIPRDVSIILAIQARVQARVHRHYQDRNQNTHIPQSVPLKLRIIQQYRTTIYSIHRPRRRGWGVNDSSRSTGFL